MFQKSIKLKLSKLDRVVQNKLGHFFGDSRKITKIVEVKMKIPKALDLVNWKHRDIILILLGLVVFLSIVLFSIKNSIFFLQIIGISYWRQLAYSLSNTIIFNIFLSPSFYILVFLILSLESIIPAKKQKAFSVGITYDFIYYIIGLIFQLTLVAYHARFINFIYAQYLSFLTLPKIIILPKVIYLIISVFILDFLLWFSHLMQHKVKFLWYFHAIHHSQKELNLFTDLRFHFVDYITTYTFTLIPLYMLNLSLPQSILYASMVQWYLRIYHANIKSNYGFLKYILVTPQSHRIHHSLENKHRDKNFGNLLSIWDHLFNTQYKNYDEYPDTGMQDNNFPFEKSLKGWNWLKFYWQQLIYPFCQIGKDINKYRIEMMATNNDIKSR